MSKLAPYQLFPIFLFLFALGLSQMRPNAAFASTAPEYGAYFSCSFPDRGDVFFGTLYDPSSNVLVTSLSANSRLNMDKGMGMAVVDGENENFSFTFYESDLKLLIQEQGNVFLGSCVENTELQRVHAALIRNFELASSPFRGCNPKIVVSRDSVGQNSSLPLLQQLGLDDDGSATLVYFGAKSSKVTSADLQRNLDVIDALTPQGHRTYQVLVDVTDGSATVFEPEQEIQVELEDFEHLAKDFRVYFNEQADGHVDHSTHSYVLLPEHGVVGFLNRSAAPGEAAQHISCLLEKSESEQ